MLCVAGALPFLCAFSDSLAPLAEGLAKNLVAKKDCKKGHEKVSKNRWGLWSVVR
jgi:hypothetical protein